MSGRGRRGRGSNASPSHPGDDPKPRPAPAGQDAPPPRANDAGGGEDAEREAGGGEDADSDAVLVARHLEGDRTAFAQIVGRYERQVYAVALRMCGRPEDARDVTQDVFVSALRGLRSFRSEAKLSTWLYRVAVNASLDVVRRRSRRETRSLDEVAEHAAPGGGPAEAAVAADRAAAVRRALERLSPEYRAVIVLHDLEDLDYAAVAEALDIPLGTVKSRIHRARLELAKLLGHLRNGEPSEGAGPLT